MKNWWEVESETEAWEKIISAPVPDPIETYANVKYILDGYDGQRATALDVGAGMGRLVKEMSKHFYYVMGVDISQSMVDLSKEYLKGARAGVKKGDGMYLPVDDSFFDFAYSYIAFQHFHTLEIVRTNIEEIYRVLKPGGVCRIQTVKGKSYRSESDGNHAYLFEDEYDFGLLFRDAGFSPVDVEVGGTHFQHIWVTGKKP